MTDKNFVLEYVQNLPHASFDCPFEDDFDTTVLRHADTKKWFGIIISIPESKIGRKTDKIIQILNLKSNPEDSIILFDLYPEIKPAYHMNKTHWITLPLDGALSDRLIASLVDKSFDLTGKKRN